MPMNKWATSLPYVTSHRSRALPSGVSRNSIRAKRRMMEIYISPGKLSLGHSGRSPKFRQFGIAFMPLF
jgi:hypothetical protein